MLENIRQAQSKMKELEQQTGRIAPTKFIPFRFTHKSLRNSKCAIKFMEALLLLAIQNRAYLFFASHTNGLLACLMTIRYETRIRAAKTKKFRTYTELDYGIKLE